MLHNAHTQQFIDFCKQFATKYIRPNVLAWDKAGAFPKWLYEELGKAGFLGMQIPEEYGGTALDYHTYTQAIIEISKVCGSVGLFIAAHNSLVSRHIVQFGSDMQKAKYLPQLASGEYLGAWALTEPSAGSDAVSLQCNAVFDGNSWVLNGSKIFITQGASAQVVVVLAKTGNEKNNITAFLVEKGTKGFSAGKPLDKLGMKACETVQLFFDNCIVPDSNRVGNAGEGFRQAMQILDGGRISITALSLGIAKGAYQIALQYAKQREQFGKKIIDFQATGFKLSQTATELYAAELMLKDACAKKDAGLSTTKESAMCKFFASELAVKTANDAVQILGGYGYTTDYLIEKYYRDAKLCTIGEGTSEIQQLIILKEIWK
ncbi:acyl-CoA dehydrogenase [Arachidicoccus ginsenosidimutans]|uniref:acyl-CoA dehydrogenase family protein n=1 Tax=Arachidicoccus sp. BS20 TaxID=1850526 RepID=UPI0007F1123F|nr:acyl-CoA dehydrogenase family protein [Arachidicoccus sp. BS20]ANI90234.1 acyl-CoA dehydrogenase [Arachidicoccus sp. BS20]